MHPRQGCSPVRGRILCDRHQIRLITRFNHPRLHRHRLCRPTENGTAGVPVLAVFEVLIIESEAFCSGLSWCRRFSFFFSGKRMRGVHRCELFVVVLSGLVFSGFRRFLFEIPDDPVCYSSPLKI